MTLDEFSAQIVRRIADARAVDAPAVIEADMAELTTRRAVFDGFAGSVMHEICEPRMQLVASKFPNASQTRVESGLRCICDFEYYDEFPASTELSLAIGHDALIQNVEVLYELRIVPVFLKYDRSDKLAFGLTSFEPSTITTWVEAMLLRFVDTYLAVAAAESLQSVALATDPVCGMRISREQGGPRSEYRGHPYYFCSQQCHEAFQREPESYVWFKVL